VESVEGEEEETQKKRPRKFSDSEETPEEIHSSHLPSTGGTLFDLFF